MISIIENRSYMSITMTILFLVLLGWVFFSKNLRDESVKYRITSIMVLLVFILPLSLKIVLTGGFLNTATDQSFTMIYIQKFLHSASFVDPLIKNSPPYYPPLFFFAAGKLSRLLNIDNILLAYNIGSLLCFSIAVAILLNFVKNVIKAVEDKLKFIYFVLFIFLFFFFFDPDFLFGKSYEFLSFMLMVIVIYEIDRKKENFSTAKVGILLGIILMLYFYSVIIFIPALCIYLFKKRVAPATHEGTGNPVPDRIDEKVCFLCKLSRSISKNRGVKISKVLLSLLICFIVSFPYSFPLIKHFFINLIQNRASYVCTDIIYGDFIPYIPAINTVQGFIICFSSLGFFLVFKKRYLLLKLQFPVIYSLYFLNLLAIAFLDRSLLITPRLWIWARILFYCTTIIFLKEFIKFLFMKFKSEYTGKITWSLALIFVIFTFQSVLISNLYRNFEMMEQRKRIHNSDISLKIHSRFKTPYPQIISDNTLLALHSPFFFFLPANLIYANPFSDLKGREKYLRKIESLAGEKLYEAFNSSPYGRIDGIIGREKNGKIKCSILTGMLLSVQPPTTFEFLLSNFRENHFDIERIGGYTLVILKPHSRGEASTN